MYVIKKVEKKSTGMKYGENAKTESKRRKQRAKRAKRERERELSAMSPSCGQTHPVDGECDAAQRRHPPRPLSQRGEPTAAQREALEALQPEELWGEHTEWVEAEVELAAEGGGVSWRGMSERDVCGMSKGAHEKFAMLND